MRLWKCEFCQKWYFHNVNFRINLAFLPPVCKGMVQNENGFRQSTKTPPILPENKTFSNGTFWLEKSYNFVCKKDGMRSGEWFQFCSGAATGLLLLMYNMIFCLLLRLRLPLGWFFFAASFKRLENNFRSRREATKRSCVPKQHQMWLKRAEQ